jgi:Glycosyl hydrolases family 15
MGGARAAQALHAIKADGLAGLRYRPPLAERFGLDAPVVRWKQVRQEIHDEVCAKGYDPEHNTFTKYYGSKELDAAALGVVLLGFLPGSDQRVTGTITAVRDGLGHDGFISRYSTAETDDGLPGSEGQPSPARSGSSPRWPERAARRGACTVRATARPDQRPRPALGEVRRRPARPDRQLPTGIQSPGADQRRGYGHGRDPSSNRQKHPRILGLI